MRLLRRAGVDFTSMCLRNDGKHLTAGCECSLCRTGIGGSVCIAAHCAADCCQHVCVHAWHSAVPLKGDWVTCVDALVRLMLCQCSILCITADICSAVMVMPQLLVRNGLVVHESLQEQYAAACSDTFTASYAFSCIRHLRCCFMARDRRACCGTRCAWACGSSTARQLLARGLTHPTLSRDICAAQTTWNFTVRAVLVSFGVQGETQWRHYLKLAARVQFECDSVSLALLRVMRSRHCALLVGLVCLALLVAASMQCIESVCRTQHSSHPGGSITLVLVCFGHVADAALVA